MAKVKDVFCKLSKAQLEIKSKFISSYIDPTKNAASSNGLDGNSNIENKNISTLASEIHKDINIQINRYFISNKIKELFGDELAEQYYKDIDDHVIYIHDESGVLYPYCMSVTLYPFLLNGTKCIGGASEAPKHLASFCGSYINLIFQLSSQCLGAVSTVEFLMYFDHFARKDYGNNYLVDKKTEIDSFLQQVVYSINQPSATRGFQSSFVNMAIFDRHFFEGLFGDFFFPDGVKPTWENLDQIQRYFMRWFNKERERVLLTFPVMTASLLAHKNDPVDVAFADFLAEELSNGNSFFIYQSNQVDSLSSCCRLHSAIDVNYFSASIGAVGIKTGSKKVITLNLNRIAQRQETGEPWLVDLASILSRVHKYLYAHDVIYEELFKGNMFPVYSANFVSLKDQYLTVGLNGIVEAAEFLGYKADNNSEYKGFLQSTLQLINENNKAAARYYNTKFNAEFVPAESLGPKNANWDKKDGFITARDCYNSYFYPVEDQSLSIIDKFELHGGDIVKYLDGGSALHLNLDDYPSKEGYLKLIKLAIMKGCNYFTTNILVTVCKDCGFIDKKTNLECRKCKSQNISHATRVIGYLKEIKSFSSERQLESSKRFYHKNS